MVGAHLYVGGSWNSLVAVGATGSRICFMSKCMRMTIGGCDWYPRSLMMPVGCGLCQRMWLWQLVVVGCPRVWRWQLDVVRYSRV